jgi:hypothetical protein
VPSTALVQISAPVMGAMWVIISLVGGREAVDLINC